MKPKKATEVTVSPDEAKTIAQEAYLFGLPLVYIGLMTDTITNVPKLQPPRAPFNQFMHYREFPDATNKTVVGFNVDTLYSLAQLDLSKEPMVLSIPEMGNRWWIMQLIDAWNDVSAAPGARTVGSKGGNFAITGPDWKGKLPGGLQEIRSDTSLAMIGGRTFTAGKSDYPNVNKIQDTYKLTPLSKWGQEYSPPGNVPVKPGVDIKTPVTRQVLDMSSESFFNRLSTMLADNPARTADAPVVERMAELGITPGSGFTMEGLEPEIRKAVEEGVETGRKVMLNTKLGEEVNGWQLARDLGRYGTKYAYRSAWTFYGVGGNLVEDAFYPLAKVDSEGRPLSGANGYELRFSKEQIPPVNAFWSLTMYDPDSYLVPNSLNRYSRGDRDKLKYDEDGSLTLYIQNKNPEKEKEGNWLPAPEAGFMVALRLYGPKKEVADGTWQPPGIRKV